MAFLPALGTLKAFSQIAFHNPYRLLGIILTCLPASYTIPSKAASRHSCPYPSTLASTQRVARRLYGLEVSIDPISEEEVGFLNCANHNRWSG